MASHLSIVSGSSIAHDTDHKWAQPFQAAIFTSRQQWMPQELMSDSEITVQRFSYKENTWQPSNSRLVKTFKYDKSIMRAIKKWKQILKISETDTAIWGGSVV